MDLRQSRSSQRGHEARFTNFGKNHPLPGRTLFCRATSPTCHLFRSAAIPSWVGKSRRHLPTLGAAARSISRCTIGETACALAQKGAGIPIVDQFVLMGEAVFSNLAVRAFEPKTDAKMRFRSKLRRLSRVSQRFVSVLADRSSGNDRAFCPLRKSRRGVSARYRDGLRAAGVASDAWFSAAIRPQRNAGITVRAHSRMNCALWSKWMLIQNWRAPALIACSSVRMQSFGVPAIENLSAR